MCPVFPELGVDRPPAVPSACRPQRPLTQLGHGPSGSMPYRPIARTYRMLPYSVGAGMRRREFLIVLGGAAAWPFAAQAQQKALPTVEYLQSGFRDETAVEAFRKGLG
jgi:hypothetical protein